MLIINLGSKIHELLRQMSGNSDCPFTETFFSTGVKKQIKSEAFHRLNTRI